MAELTGDARSKTGLSRGATLFVATSFVIQIALVFHFALRTWAFQTAMDLGWIVYALGVPAVVVSVVLVRHGDPPYLAAAGLLYAIWAALGFVVDIANPTEWRSPILWPVFIPYVGLYLAAQMFYWWPLGAIRRSLWLAYGVLFVISTGLNIASHP